MLLAVLVVSGIDVMFEVTTFAVSCNLMNFSYKQLKGVLTNVHCGMHTAVVNHPFVICVNLLFHASAILHV